MKIRLIFSPLVFVCLPALGHGVLDITEQVVIEGRQLNLLGEAISASQGVVGQEEIQLRAIARTGDILEYVPGMVVTQHSGSGKANQYFLRGFNLDHGTDFATTVDGMPVNMRTHGHGQGYSDLNFVIPETLHNIQYQKGSYYANVGDFSGAGSASLQTFQRPQENTVSLGVGEHAYQRGLIIGGLSANEHTLAYALEHQQYDGPWSDIEEDLDKRNGLLKYSRRVGEGRVALSFMAYDNAWNSADQIPLRAVAANLIDELGSIDTTLGGESSRYSVNMQWLGDGVTAGIYAITYDLNLWSNFTYFLEDESEGDQFEQVDERSIYGGHARFIRTGEWLGRSMENELGFEVRLDAIDEVGLYKSDARTRTGVIRADAVDEFSAGLYWQNELQLSERLRSHLGVRHDYYDFEVSPVVDDNLNDVELEANGGDADDAIWSVKGGLSYSLNAAWEAYASAGQGFHSNDARGTTIRVDPADGSAVAAVDPLVRSLGYEMGLRGFLGERLNTSIALWTLEVDSELLFVGDAGTTEASRASERKGVELTAYYRLAEHWLLDLEYAWTDAEFSDSSPEGDHIPGALEHVLQAGVSTRWGEAWRGSVRLRWFGERPLLEDDSVRSDASAVVNMRLGYHADAWAVTADILNLFDSNDHDIDYYYESRLAQEPSGVAREDLHYHVLEPRALRLSVALHF